MRAQLITNFNSIKEWKDYCFKTNSSYLRNKHFKKWINKKDIYIFNLSNLKKLDIKYIKLGIEDPIKLAKLHFKIHYGANNIIKKIINSTNEKIDSNKLLKMIIKHRKENQREYADVFIVNSPIDFQGTAIHDGEALTFVNEGVMIFSFETFKKYPHTFLRRRAKHEALHLLGLNVHHEGTKVKGYNYNVLCNMCHNAPTQLLCSKCKSGLISFWKGIEYAAKKQFIKN